jgi:hypothetical protein
MALVEKHPQLLYNRIIFMFDEQVPRQAMTAMTETLTAFYNKFNDRVNFLRDWKAGRPLPLLRLACRHSLPLWPNGPMSDPRLFCLCGTLLVDGTSAGRVVYSRITPFLWHLL